MRLTVEIEGIIDNGMINNIVHGPGLTTFICKKLPGIMMPLGSQKKKKPEASLLHPMTPHLPPHTPRLSYSARPVQVI